MTADQRQLPQVLDIAATDAGWVCTLSQGEIQHHRTDPIAGSLESVRNAIAASGMPLGLIVTTLTHSVGIEVLVRETASAPQKWLLEDHWADLAESLGGRYWTPRDSTESPHVARAYFQGTAFIQVKVYEDAEGRGILGCPSPVYVSVPLTVSGATTAAICKLARGCCDSAALVVMAARLETLSAPGVIRNA